MSHALVFVVQPSRTPANAPITPAPQVAVQDQSGQTDVSAVAAVTIRLGSAGQGTGLSGSLSIAPVAGVAVFDNLRVDGTGAATLVASAAGASDVTSEFFRVFPSYSRIAAGGGHTCAASSVGTGYCWGRYGEGQLGIGAATPTGSPNPVSAPPGVTFADVGAGGYHSCGLAPPGAIYCWGDNTFRQLGDGTTDTKTSPVLVQTPGGLTFTGLSVGYWHSCATTSDGKAYCWGLNVEGELGDGTTTTPATPVSVAIPPGVAFAAVSAGGGHSCAMTIAGAAYCWGENPYGGLGDGTTAPHAQPEPVATPTGVGFVAISAGDEHSCGLTSGGAVYCWGRNDTGQLGDGTTTSRSTPVRVAAPDGIAFTRIDAGRLRTCGVTATGPTYCWGQNDLRGLLGDGTTVDRSSPVLVAAPAGVTFAAVDVGPEHSCAATAYGVAYCWGYNGYGQLGDGTGLTRMTPVLVNQ